MRLLIVLVSGDEAVRAFFDRRKQGVVPRDAVLWGGSQPAIDIKIYRQQTGPGSKTLGDFLQDAALQAEGILILHDEWGAARVENFGHAALLIPFSAEEAHASPENVLQRTIARALRNLRALRSSFAAHDRQKILLLPLRNFYAADLTALEALVRGHHEVELFADELSQRLSAIRRERRRPKPGKRFKTTYLVDDRGRHFDYGLERHARVAVTGEGHSVTCALSSIFRFGLRYDPERHYNVSFPGKDEAFEGDIENCHGITKHEWRKSHLNLFPNGSYE
jgi:hypothetical protein